MTTYYILITTPIKFPFRHNLKFISFVLSTYKAIFIIPEVGNLEELELKEDESIKDSKDILEELDIDDTNLDIEEPRILEEMQNN